jgi:hypothetical protein
MVIHVSFEVETEFLNIIRMSFGFKGLNPLDGAFSSFVLGVRDLFVLMVYKECGI